MTTFFVGKHSLMAGRIDDAPAWHAHVQEDHMGRSEVALATASSAAGGLCPQPLSRRQPPPTGSARRSRCHTTTWDQTFERPPEADAMAFLIV